MKIMNALIVLALLSTVNMANASTSPQSGEVAPPCPARQRQLTLQENARKAAQTRVASLVGEGRTSQTSDARSAN